MARKYMFLRIAQIVRNTVLYLGFFGVLIIGMIVDCPNWNIVYMAGFGCVALILFGVLIDYFIGKGVFVGNLDFKTIMDWNQFAIERPHKMKGQARYYAWLKRYQLKDTKHNFEYFCRRYCVRKPVVKV